MSEQTSSSLVSAPEGILYSAFGETYIAEAIRSARSSMAHNRLPHLLLASTDVESVEGLSVARFEPSAHPFADRTANMRRSPFERTIFLDSDTFVVDEIAHVLRLLDHYDIAVTRAPYRPTADPEVPTAFYEFNVGVVVWRHSDRMAAFLRSWEETYLAWLREEPFLGAGDASRGGRGDQPAFRHCAWQHDVRLYVLPPEYNFRFDFPATAAERVRVLHGRHGNYDALAARVNYKQGARTWPRPLPLRAKAVKRTRKVASAAGWPVRK
jgi:hypothetical protein